MGWLVCFVYLLAFAVLVGTGNLWCLACAAFVLFGVITGSAITVARRESSHDSLEDEAELLRGSFGGDQGASDE